MATFARTQPPFGRRFAVPAAVAALAVAGTIALAPTALAAPSSAAEPHCNHIPDEMRPLVAYGDEGAAVLQAQCLVNTYSRYPGRPVPLNGVYDRDLLLAVMYVKHCNRVPPMDAYIDPRTWDKLYKPAPPCAANPAAWEAPGGADQEGADGD